VSSQREGQIRLEAEPDRSRRLVALLKARRSDAGPALDELTWLTARLRDDLPCVQGLGGSLDHGLIPFGLPGGRWSALAIE
jgi:hypothetical protein